MSHNVQHQIAAIMRRRGGFSFETALRLLAPYSPRLAYNFIDPANSLFQGNTLTPVTSVTNPIRVVVDQTQGAFSNPGSEIYTSPPNFSDASWSIVSAGISKSGQTITRTTNDGGVARSGLSIGKIYFVRISYSKTNGTSVFGVGDGTGAIYYSSTAETGVLEGYFVSASVTIYLRIGVAADVVTVNSISVREIPGNHARASSDAKRPLFARYPATGRRNLLTQTEQFGSPLWIRGNSLQIDLSQLDVEGGTRAVRLRKTTTALQSVYQNLATGTYRNSIFVKADTVNRIGFSAGASPNLIIDVVTNSVVANSGTLTSVTIEPLTDGWCRISYVNSDGTALYMWPTDSSTLVFTTTSATASVFVCLPQAESGSASATAYQKVVTSADITEAGVRDVYASLYDGSDDCLQVSGFDLSDTDEVTVIAGARKLSDAATAVLLEHSASWLSASGSFVSAAPDSALRYSAASRGSAAWALDQVASTSSTTYNAPNTVVYATTHDIANDRTLLYLNGTLINTATGDKGTGNFSNNTLNIGGRNNSASLPFNGYLHYLFICGAIVPDDILTRIYRGLGPRIGLTV